MNSKLLTGVEHGFTKGMYVPGLILHKLRILKYSLAREWDYRLPREKEPEVSKSISYQVGSGIGDVFGALLCLAFPPGFLLSIGFDALNSRYWSGHLGKIEEDEHQSLLAGLESCPKEEFADRLESCLASYEQEEIEKGRDPQEVKAYVDALRVHLTIYREEIRDEAFRAARMGGTTLDGAVRAMETIRGLK